MRKRSCNTLMAVLLAGALAACDDNSLTGPNSDDLQSTETQLSVDPELTEVIVADAEAAISAAVGEAPALSSAPVGVLFSEPDPGDVDRARELLQMAREKFAEARQAYSEGRIEEARALAMEGRLLVAEAMVLVFGEGAYERLCERVLNAISWLEERVDGGDSDLLNRIRELKDEAESLRAEDEIGAVERLLLALQIAHHERADQRRDDFRGHARFAIFMANSAIGLATDIVGDDATEEQIHALRHAQHLLAHAEEAFSNGRFRVSFTLAREAINLALVAVLREPGTDAGRVQMMIELSEQAIAAAEEALQNGEPTEFALRLFEQAEALQARGLELAETEPRKAVHILWHASVMAYGVVQLVS